jgi:hypothetical protein
MSLPSAELSLLGAEVSRYSKDRRDVKDRRSFSDCPLSRFYPFFRLAMPSPPEDRFIPAQGGYRKLRSYQKAEIIYDATVFSMRGSREPGGAGGRLSGFLENASSVGMAPGARLCAP